MPSNVISLFNFLKNIVASNRLYTAHTKIIHHILQAVQSTFGTSLNRAGRIIEEWRFLSEDLINRRMRDQAQRSTAMITQSKQVLNKSSSFHNARIVKAPGRRRAGAR
jgi:hypothetical protein